MGTYEQALFLDVSLFAICATMLIAYGNLSFSHPAIPYLIFHLYAVTLRIAGLMTGDGMTLFSRWQASFDPVLPEEIARAARYFDLALVMMTVTWLWLRARKPSTGAEKFIPLNPKLVWAVISVAFPVGIAGLLIGAQLPGVQPNEGAAILGDWSSSSYIFITQTWCGLALLAYIYCYGFKRLPVVLLVVYLLIMVFQGYHRFRVVIPVLMMAQIWLDRHRLRWPPKWMVGAFLVVIMFFFPLKAIGRMWQAGGSLSDIGTIVSDSTQQVLAGEADDQMFLDQAASAVTLFDMSGTKYWGKMYLALLTLPIPRQWWPDKPSVADFLTDISIPSRPMRESGMIVTFVGEAYGNFGLFGVLLVPPLLAAFLTILYRRAYLAGYNTVARFAYVLICVNLIEIYRDGLTSLVMFTFVNTLPLMAIIVLHGLTRFAPVTARLRAPAAQAR
jgi:hypothetical protein